ncbi:MAG: glycosyltransferase family 2 protein [Omnitrophica bacterium]|nr:glycosyltransferase family 2 protein [Candidatus Omnitrophota bacterium]
MDLSIIVVAYNVKDLVKKCLTRIRNSEDKLKKEIIFVDNASSDGTAEMIKIDFPEVVLVESTKNLGFIRANNLAYEKVKGKFILLLNSDAFIEEDTLQKTINFMKTNQRCGVLGCRLVDINGNLQPSARYFPTPWRIFLSYSGIGYKFPDIPFLRGIDNMKWNHRSVREIDWVPGCYFLIRRDAIDEIGFLEKDYFLYYDDCDFCLRAKRKGWKVLFYPETEVIHLGGATLKRMNEVTSKGGQNEKFRLRSEFIYFRKHYGILYTLLDFFFIIALDYMEILERLLIQKKHFRTSDKLKHIRMAYDNLVVTRFGERPVD